MTADDQLLISPWDKFREMWQGRTPEPLQDPIFNSVVDWIRLILVTLSTFGLFYTYIMHASEEGKLQRTKEAKMFDYISYEQLV